MFFFWSLVHLPGLALGMLAPLVGATAFRVWAAVDAYRCYRDPTGQYRPWWRRAAIAGLLLVGTMLLDTRASASRRRYVGDFFRLPSPSMAPVLLPGDRIITAPLDGKPPARGQIVVFRWPDDTTKSFVKRVVGLPGDTLAMREGVMIVNGDRLAEPYAHHSAPGVDPAGDELLWQREYLAAAAGPPASYRPSRNNWGPLVIPPEAYFVLGDDRDNSLDSRYMGLIKRSFIYAEPRRVYFSRDPQSGAFRWRRIGTRV